MKVFSSSDTFFSVEEGKFSVVWNKSKKKENPKLPFERFQSCSSFGFFENSFLSLSGFSEFQMCRETTLHSNFFAELEKEKKRKKRKEKKKKEKATHRRHSVRTRGSSKL
jgi:transposase